MIWKSPLYADCYLSSSVTSAVTILTIMTQRVWTRISAGPESIQYVQNVMTSFTLNILETISDFLYSNYPCNSLR